MWGITRQSLVNVYKSAFNTDVETIKICNEVAIKEVVDLDLDNCIVYVNGFQQNGNYILKDKDVCTIRQFPKGSSSSSTVTDVIGWMFDPIGSAVSAHIHKNGHSSLTNAIDDIKEAIADSITDSMKDSISSSSVSASETDSVSVSSSPSISGSKNQSLLGKTYPFIMGKTYFAPYYIGQPYTTLEDNENGSKYQIFHCLYMIGYNQVKIDSFSLGLYKLTTLNSLIQSGEVPINGFYNKDKYNIKIEIQNSDEVSIYNEKVVQTNFNINLMCMLYEETEGNFKNRWLEVEKLSARYPRKIEIEYLVNGLGNTKENSDEYIVCEYSLDGGVTFTALQIKGATLGNYAIPSSETANTKVYIYCNEFEDSMAEQRRYVAVLEFTTYNQVKDINNDTVVIRTYRVSPTNRTDTKCYNQGIYLSSIRTWCYDKEKSKSQNRLVPQTPLCEKDRLRTTRVGFQIKILEDITDLKEFNCIVQSMGRTYSNGVWSSKNQLSPTSNPASVALLALQSEVRGEEVYSDSELDMDDFGRFYDWCKNYNIKNASKSTVGFQISGVVVKSEKTNELLYKILQTGRGSLRLNGNKYGVFIDKRQENPVMVLNNQNVIEASNQKLFEEEIQGVSVKFNNEDNYYLQDEIIVSPDKTKVNDTNLKTKAISLPYQTNVEQIYKNALFELAKYTLRPEVWVRKVTTEGNVVEVGSLVIIQDDSICVGIGDGAEVLSLIFDDETNPTQVVGIKTDGEFEVSDMSLQYGVEIQVANGESDISFIKRQVDISAVGTYNDLYFTAPISLDNKIPTVGDIVSFGVLNRETTDAICVEKEEDGENNYTLTLVPYQDGLYDADSGNIPEFDSCVTVPQKKNVKTNVEENLLDLYNKIELQSEQPSKPVITSVVAYKDYVRFNTSILTNGVKNSIKKYEYKIVKHDGSTITINSATPLYDYYFNRTEDGYLETDSLDLWKVSVRVTNVNDGVSEWSDEKSLSYFVDKSEYTWIPKKAVVTTPNANKDGFDIEWTCGKCLGTNKYVVKVYYNDEVSFTSNVLNEEKYSFKFDREVDGYPEKNVFDNTRNLNNYKVVVLNYNESRTVENAVQSDETSLNLDDYGTWRIDTFTTNCVSVDVVDRTILLKLITPTSSLEYYGTTSFKVSIKRIGISAVEGGEGYPEITPDENWYKPDLYSSPLNNELAYRTNEIDGYEITSGRYSQTMPLIGQSSNCIYNTIYSFKISAYNNVGYETNSVEISVTALCTSIRDIVKANEDYKDLYVTKLSALNANVGMISKGGFGDFANFTNFWALTKMLPEDTGLSEIVKEGAFRVGDDKEFIAVIPPNSSFGEGENKITNTSADNFMIKIKAGNISMTTNSSSSDSGTYIYDSVDSNKRLQVKSTGIEVQQRTDESSLWEVKARFSADTDGNMTISNSDESDLTLPKKGIYVPNCSVYHLERSILDTNGGNSANITFDDVPNYEPSSLINENNYLYYGSLRKIFTPKEESDKQKDSMCFFYNGKYIVIDKEKVCDIEDGSLSSPIGFLSQYFSNIKTEINLGE